MKEYKINEIFIHTDGKVYQCVEAENGERCERCAFVRGEYRCAEVCIGPRSRTDGRSVIFIEVTEPADGMLYRAKNGRMYRLAKGIHYDHQCACDTAPSLGCSALDRAVFKTPLLDWYWAPVEEEAPVESPKSPEPPKLHIELAVVKVEGDTVKFRIAEQTYRCDEFSRQDCPSEFKAANGLQLRSAVNPQWFSPASALYCRGADKEKDMREITCTAVEFARICEAVADYNETDGKGCEPRWPSVGDKYFCIAVDGKLDRLTFDRSEIDRKIQDFGNFFRTKEEAEAALERVKQALKK